METSKPIIPGKEKSMPNTPYDDVFRTLLNDCSPLILPVINEVFGETYTGEEKIVFSPNEHFLNSQDGREQERVTDTCFKVLGTKEKKYHWECQSSPDSSMLVRIFEYDAQIALDQGEIRGNKLIVTFPHSAVLFLRCNSSTPEEMEMEIRTSGTNASYNIPVMKSQRFTVDEIFEKRLLFLIPFHIFSHESRFKLYEKDPGQRKKLTKEYEDICRRLEKLLEEGVIDEYTKCTILDMSRRVLRNIAKKYKKVKKGVKSVMGGKVLDYEAKRIRTAGLLEGRKEGQIEGKEEGRKEGKLETLIELVHDNVLTVQEAAFRAKLTETEFRSQMKKHNK